ncbi:MAG: ABC transporter substrate-binding protein [Betaproteobacteria bacterium]|nr:MAG: ABC transporter substrate-binding protein [Betaproteobacteria bacterium]
MKLHRVLVTLIMVLIWPGMAAAQGEGVPVIGVLITHASPDDRVVHALRKGLRDYGYEDGRNIRVEVRSAMGELHRVPALAEELVELDVQAIVLVNETAARAALRATSTIPIVLLGYTDDPLALGWIESYRHPGGNVTGIFSLDAELCAKRLEILKDLLPDLSRVAVFWDSYGHRQVKAVENAADALGLELALIEVKGADDLDSAFRRAKARKVDALLLLWSPVFYVNSDRIGMLTLQAELPLITELTPIVYAGGLVSYGSERYYNWERAAYFIDRILKGTKAADLPMERPARFKMVVNHKSAEALGITIPQSILLRADEVIE